MAGSAMITHNALQLLNVGFRQQGLGQIHAVYAGSCTVKVLHTIGLSYDKCLRPSKAL